MKYTLPTPQGVQEALALQEGKRQLPLGLTSHHIRRYGAFVAATIECHDHLERAMVLAKEQIRYNEHQGHPVASGHVILAKHMKASKGRFTRTWHAPEGGLWGCLIHANTLLPLSRRFIPFAVGIACCETVRECGLGTASLRWVNDVLFEGKKLAGFLVESFTAPESGEIFNLVGFGININNSQFPEELVAIASSVGKCLGKSIEIGRFAEKFLANLAWNIGLLYAEEERFLSEECYSGEGGKHILVDRFLQLSDVVGKRVVYGFDVMEDPQYEATVLAVDGDGGLVLQLDDGYQKIEYSGEVRYL